MYDTIRKIIEQGLTLRYTGLVPLKFDGTGGGEDATTDFIRGYVDSVQSISGTIGTVSEEALVGLYVLDIFTKKNKGLSTANQTAINLQDALYLRNFSEGGVYLEVQKLRFTKIPSNSSTFNHHQLVFTLHIRKQIARVRP